MSAAVESMLRLLALFAGGAAVAFCVAAWLVARSVLTPRRATAGWALAKGFPVDPGALGLEWTESGDSSLRAWRIAGRGGADAPVLLLLHGWNRSRIDSLRRLEPLLDHCAVAYLPDLPGHGDSAGSTAVGASEHRALLHFLDDRSDEWRANGLIIAGHSLGAVVGLHLAAALTAREHAAAPTPHLRRPLPVIAWAPYESAVQPIAARLQLHHLALPMLATAAHALLRVRTGAVRPTSQVLADVSKRGAQLVFVSGQRDRIVPPTIVASLAASGGTAVQVLHGNADHAELGTVADDSNAGVLAWLRSVRASG